MQTCTGLGVNRGHLVTSAFCGPALLEAVAKELSCELQERQLIVSPADSDIM